MAGRSPSVGAALRFRCAVILDYDLPRRRSPPPAALTGRPDDARYRSALGIAYAGLGRKEDAIREGELAVELLPMSKEAWRGAYRVEDLARIYATVGEYEVGRSPHSPPLQCSESIPCGTPSATTPASKPYSPSTRTRTSDYPPFQEFMRPKG